MISVLNVKCMSRTQFHAKIWAICFQTARAVPCLFLEPLCGPTKCSHIIYGHTVTYGHFIIVQLEIFCWSSWFILQKRVEGVFDCILSGDRWFWLMRCLILVKEVYFRKRHVHCLELIVIQVRLDSVKKGYGCLPVAWPNVKSLLSSFLYITTLTVAITIKCSLSASRF